jgi:CRP/FNR family transcriptional regulator, anaerobic regulatory protein
MSLPASPPVARCSTCSMRHLCVPEGLSAEQTATLETLILDTRPVRRGETLFRADDAFHALFAVRCGSFKTLVAHAGGREQVSGLYLAGETLGLDGIGERRHACSAVALEDSSVCVIPYALLERTCRETGAIQRRFHQLMSREIARDGRQMALLTAPRADERVAQFLLDFSARLAQRGYAAAEFTLRMTRNDLGSYLGMTLETVSRTLSRLHRRGLISAQGKHIRIRDFDGLRAA